MFQRPMNLKDLIEAIQENTEWLETTEGDSVECISIENLQTALFYYFNKPIKLTSDGN